MGFLGRRREPRKAARRMTIYWPAYEMHPEGCKGRLPVLGRHAELKNLGVANDNPAASMFDVVVTIRFLDGSGRIDSVTEMWRIIQPGELRNFSFRGKIETFMCPDPERPPLGIEIEFRDEDKRRWKMRYGGKVHRLNGFSGWCSRTFGRSSRPSRPIFL